MNTTHYFWVGWLYRSAVESWSFAGFLGFVAPPAIVFLQVHTLLTAHPDSIADWRAHFWQVRRWFFGANVLLPLSNLLLLHVVVGRELMSVESLSLVLNLVLSGVGLASSNERVHGAVAILYLSNLSLGLGNLIVQTR